ncbi:MAG: CDP-diacylglycerol--serine O-phosphatidyltransferase [Candidatus Cloacimonetes bacterium]|nr:CDP-diacylglycerol--serine O-phosphatidyltransferase [Candidatus Cloacimonadota bacterium]
MKSIKYLIPNFFTSLSLLSALIAIHYISIGEFILAPWLIMFSMICDFLDGKFARILDAATPFGALFDTMSDFVAFGIAPAFLIYQVSLYRIPFLGALVTIIFVFSGCFRLVRFSLRNNDIHKKSSFIGLPIPIAAGFISSSVILSLRTWNQIPDDNIFMIIVFLISILMISRIEYLTIEQDTLYRKNFRFLFALFLISAVVTFKYFYIAILFWITSYILFCLLRHIFVFILNKQRFLKRNTG